MAEDASVLKRIADLPNRSHAELKDLWREYFGVEPPAYRRGFLIRGLAHRIQELAYGGLEPAYQKRLEALIAGSEDPGRKRRRSEVDLVAGTRLIRDWKGEPHEVTVLSDGFEYRGKPYRSLSAIARAITGTRWNGPLFFGLRKNGAERRAA